MGNDHAKMLAEARRAFLIAPAGCGKTHTIADAVTLSQGRQLVLTHTHAGVHALERKLKEARTGRDSYRVQTIATWALRYVTAYPLLSGFRTSSSDPFDWALLTDDDYEKAYDAAATLLQKKAIADVVRATYAGVYVDEYQDCTLPQERLVLALGDLIPCRVLGDPLQGIFDFAGTLVDMNAVKDYGFACVPPLEIPMRWQKKGNDAALGRWLTDARRQVESTSRIDITPFWCKGDYSARVDTCRKLMKRKGSTVIIRNRPNECRKLARRLGGAAQCIEEIHGKELLRICRELDCADGSELALKLTWFAGQCLTGLGKRFEDGVSRFFQNGRTTAFVTKHSALVSVLEHSTKNHTPRTVLQALEALYTAASNEGGRLFRPDLWSGMKRALRAKESRDFATLEAAARQTRRELAQAGRCLPRVVVSTTRLVKGLEFDHAIVFSEGLDERHLRNLYVAITRASKSLTVFSDSPIIVPAPQPVPRQKKNKKMDHPCLDLGLPGSTPPP